MDLRGKGEAAAVEAENIGLKAEVALAVMAAAKDNAGEKEVNKGDGFSGEVANGGIVVVAIRNLIKASTIPTRRAIGGSVHGKAACDRRVREGRQGVEDGIRLLVAVGAGLELDPCDVTADVEYEVERLRQAANAHA